ncbi:MAG: hypothetical protein LBK67_00460 [Coriobacteriales bacterium]|jgi:hypothetical protein|nr:hypothetical protein [Coriobacteriales bacterium]
MTQLIEYVDELIQEVGPRPAGTQQEHQAAELIAARLDEFGMKVDIEEFPCARNIGWVRVLYYALCVAGAALSIFFANFRIIGAILVIAGVILMLLDFLGKNPLFTLFKNSLSQNVIARYLPPGSEPSSRNRKVVILAHYDSARTMVQAAPLLVPYYAQLRRVIRIAMIALVVFVLLMLIPFPPVVLTILSVLVGVAAAIVLLAFLAEVVNLFMPYNQGANCNGSSIGVLYGLAQTLSSGADTATLRRASDSRGKGRSPREDGASSTPHQAAASAYDNGKRSGRKTRATGESPVASGAEGGKVAATMGGLLSRLQGKTRSQEGRSAGGQKTAASQDTQGIDQSSRHEVSAEQERQTNVSTPQTKANDSSVRSVGDNLANPFISQRPPLSEIEEANRLREEERAQRLEEQRKRMQAEENRTEDGVPLWFVKAKQNAEKKAEQNAERRQRTSDKPEIVRSRFADVPTFGRLQRETEEERERQAAEQSSAQDSVPSGVGEQAHEQTAVVSGEAARESATDGSAAPTAYKPVERPQPIIRSTVDAQPASVGGDGNRPAVPNAQPAQPVRPAQIGQPQVTPVTAAPDFSGLDRQAFKVLPGEERKGNAVIVPGQVESVVEDDIFSEEDRRIFDTLSKSADQRQGVRRGADQGQGELFSATTPSNGQGRASKQNRLFDLPTLSAEHTGNIPAQQAGFDAEPVAREELFSAEDSVVSATGSFMPLGTTGVMKPVGGELLSYHNEGEIYIHDADDTAISERYSQTGEYSEPELVNIPESRVKSFLGSVGDRLSGKKKEKLESSPSAWLGVDERFDARKEGSAIGSWENFGEDDDWNGGAYGGATYEENVKAVVSLSHELLDKEVWLVALGANESKNAGLANLFANHSSELKSALFVNLLGVGIGDLVFTVSEGNYRPAQTDHRMQSLISSAAQSMAIPIGPVKFSAFATDCTETLKRGGRAISIMGLKKQVPVGWRWSDDEVSRLREDNMSDTAALVIETIKNS